jgi:hypothetical protein
MLYACVERFDVIGGRGNILGWDGEVNKALDEKYRCRSIYLGYTHRTGEHWNHFLK